MSANTIKLAIVSLVCGAAGVAGREPAPNVILIVVGCVGLLAALSDWDNNR